MRYLDELERDLVAAIDRRAATSAWRRPERLRPALAIALAVLAVVAAIAALRPDRQRERTVVAPPVAVTPMPTAVPAGRPLRIVGRVLRADPSTWRGDASGLGRPGTLTITGEVDVRPRACCEAPGHAGAPPRRTISFTWTTPDGTLSGCIANAVYRRPHGRFVWDGTGRVTSATGVLRRHRHDSAAIAGRTPVSSPGEARIILGTGGDTPPGSC